MSNEHCCDECGIDFKYSGNWGDEVICPHCGAKYIAESEEISFDTSYVTWLVRKEKK